MFRRKRRDIPLLNTTSTADISFMLLIFFLVTSSMDTDKGLPRQMPPPNNSEEEVDVEMKSRNVLALRLDAHDQLTCNDEPISNDELTRRVQEFVANKDNAPNLPEKSRREVHMMGSCQVSDRHIITVEADRLTSYNAYFEMQNAIVRGYALLRDELARQQFGHGLAQCSQEERDALAMVYPQRISERMAETQEEGGQP